MNKDKEQRFISAIRQSLDQTVDGLDAVTRARLKAVRLTALEAQHKTPYMQNRLAFATAASVLLVAGVWWWQKPVEQSLPLEDLSLLTANEDLELYRDLEFYQWLETQREQG